MKTSIAIAFVCFVAANAAAVEPVVDILAIAGKSSLEVEDVLGEPTGREMKLYAGKKRPLIYYRRGDVQILFLNGRANIIDVTIAKRAVKDPAEVLELIGLDHSIPPTWRKPESGLMGWERIQGLDSVQLLQFRDTRGKITKQTIKVWLTPVKYAPGEK